jgi:hypothetical protein
MSAARYCQTCRDYREGAHPHGEQPAQTGLFDEPAAPNPWAALEPAVAVIPTIAEARKARDEAIAAVDEHADDEWKDRALEAVRRTALVLDEFISDDIWTTAGLDRPRESRAMGPVLRRAAALGYIEKTGKALPSAQGHLRPVHVWRSLLRGQL